METYTQMFIFTAITMVIAAVKPEDKDGINAGALPDLNILPPVIVPFHWARNTPWHETIDAENIERRTWMESAQSLYRFKYFTPHQGHQQSGDMAGSKFGRYFVEGENCVRTEIRYYADETGYHPKINNIQMEGCITSEKQKIPPIKAASSLLNSEIPLDEEPSHLDFKVIERDGSEVNLELLEEILPPTTKVRHSENKIDETKSARMPKKISHLEDITLESTETSKERGQISKETTSKTKSCGNERNKRNVRPRKPYGFAYNAGTHYHWEKGYPNGTISGAYAIQSADGSLRTTEYSANCQGFSARTVVQPLSKAQFLEDFNKFEPPAEARLFQASNFPHAVPQASVKRPTRIYPSSQLLSKLHKTREQQAAREHIRLPAANSQLENETPSPFIFTTNSALSQQTTEKPNSRLDPITPIRPQGSGLYHFYINLERNYHEERSYKNGSVQGRYGVVAPDGILREVFYNSQNGFIPELKETMVGKEHNLCSRPSSL